MRKCAAGGHGEEPPGGVGMAELTISNAALEAVRKPAPTAEVRRGVGTQRERGCDHETTVYCRTTPQAPLDGPGGVSPVGACFLYFFPLSALLGHGEHWLWGRVPLATWVLIGLAFLLLAIIERLALIIVELKTLTFVCTNLLKDADDPDGLINQFALSRMRQTIRRALGVRMRRRDGSADPHSRRTHHLSRSPGLWRRSPHLQWRWLPAA